MCLKDYIPSVILHRFKSLFRQVVMPEVNWE